MDQQKNAPSADAPGNTRSNGVLPNWLDSRTIAILTTLLTVALALGAMIQATNSRMDQGFGQLRQEIGELRRELSADIENVRDELGAEIKGLDARLRTVEIDVAAIRERVSAIEGHTHDRDPWDTRSRDG